LPKHTPRSPVKGALPVTEEPGFHSWARRWRAEWGWARPFTSRCCVSHPTYQTGLLTFLSL